MSRNRKRASDADLIYDNHLTQGKRFRTSPSMQRTAIIERMYTRILSEMCVNRFKWTGLEGTGIDIRFMELTLFRFALSVVFKHKATDRIVAVQGAPAGQMNWAQNPTAFTVVGNMMRGGTIPAKQCVPVWSNYMRMPDMDIVYVYAKKLAEIDVSIELAADAARRPMVAFVNENQRLSATNIIQQVRQGDPVIAVNADMFGQLGSAGTLSDMITSVDFGSDPDAIEKLHIVKTRLWGECMTYLGFDAANQDKKERLVAAEVDANNSQVDGMRAVNLNARKQAAAIMSKRYNLNVNVEYHITTETSQAIAVPPTPGGMQ